MVMIFMTNIVNPCSDYAIFQALINMAVAVELLPVTGQTLPLISAGGTSIWMTCISIGIILSVTKKEDEVAQDAEESKKREETLHRIIDKEIENHEEDNTNKESNPLQPILNK